MTDDSAEWRAALASRLPSTWTMRRRSAITGGRSGSTSTARVVRPPALVKALLARSSSSVTSVGSGSTASVPVSMRATSSRSPMSARIWSDWSRMMRWNWAVSAGSSSPAPSSSVAIDPLTAARGIRSSWLTVARNSARRRSSSSTAAMSCTVTTTDSTAPSSERMGVALSSTRTLRPSGTRSTTSSARSVSVAPSSPARGNSRRETSLPSARTQVITSSSVSGDCPGSRRLSAMRCPSRLSDFRVPDRASKTTTPTGEVSISVSRSARARRSSRWVRALAITSAAWAANMTRVCSSSRLNARPSSRSFRKMLPTRRLPWSIGEPRKGEAGATGQGRLNPAKPRDRT